MKKKPLIYNVKISLDGIKPLIWRTLLIQSDLFLHDFHKILQTTMGWENSHLHEFIKNGKTFGIADDSVEDGDHFIDYTSVRVVDLLKSEGDSFKYIYDFGDYWIHTISVEKIYPNNDDYYYPICIEGERNCPPENCGGVIGYMDLIEIIVHPGHPQREKILDWLGDDYDPNFFDQEEVNDFLMEDDFGCLPYFD